MTPQEIVDRIADFALDEVDADNDLETRILNDVNEIYRDLQKKIATRDRSGRYAQTENVTITSGSGTVSSHVHIFSVYDSTNDRLLEESDVATIEQLDPSLDEENTPREWYVTGNTSLNVYPIGDITARVRFYPTPNTLALTDAESDIRIPAIYHDVLVKGGKYLMSIREQGFHDARDRREKELAYRLAEKELLTYLSSNNASPNRVMYHDV